MISIKIGPSPVGNITPVSLMDLEIINTISPENIIWPGIPMLKTPALNANENDNPPIPKMAIFHINVL